VAAQRAAETYRGAAARKAAFDEAEAEEQRLYEHPASEGNTAPHERTIRAPPLGTQPGA
jgi:hypothetical protein